MARWLTALHRRQWFADPKGAELTTHTDAFPRVGADRDVGMLDTRVADWC
jgi:hypothetical protein